MSQNKTIMIHLYSGSSITALEAIHKYSILRLAARISDLKDKPYDLNIETEYKTGKNGGRYAIYRLRKEKEK